MSASRGKGPRKDGPSQPQRGRGGGPGSGGAWRGHNPSIMQSYNNPRTPSPMMGPPTPNSANSGPNQPAYGNNAFAGQNDVAKAGVSSPPSNVTLPPADLIGSPIHVTTNTGSRYEGILAQSEQQLPGINLRDAKDIVAPSSAPISTYFIPLQQVANWKKPDPPPAPSANGNKVLDTFRTDTDISGMANKPRERELQAWKPDGGLQYADTNGLGRDTLTFGTAQPNGQWDQFAANEHLFGVTTDYNEDIYTTKLDRNTVDYKDKERKAQQLADEIQGSTAANPHVREERNQGDGVMNEEDKYGAVVRSPGAYVPPGARRPGEAGPPSKPPQPSTSATPPIPKVSINPPEASAAEQTNGTSHSTPNGTSDQTAPAQPNGTPTGSKPKEPGVITSFRDFVSSEKERMTQKKQALVKHEKDKRLSELIEFSKSFKLKQTIPEDLVPILAKDQEKQKAIKEKAAKDAEDNKARLIGVAIPPAAGTLPIPDTGVSPPAPAPSSSKSPSNRISVIPPIPPFKGGPAKNAAAPAGGKPAGGSPVSGPSAANASTKPGAAAPTKRIPMTIQKIPPFDPSKRKNLESNAPAASGSASTSNGATTPVSPSAAPSTSSKLNANASAFNPKATAFKPGGPSPAPSGTSDKPVDPPNPYFGVRRVQKTPVHIKEEFNPFRYNKVSDAGSVPAVWPFTGKKYMQMFPQIPHPPPVPTHQQAPPPYEEDSNAQAAQAARMGYPMMFYGYPPYGGAPPPPQHMMAAPNAAPPGGYMGSPYMQPMGYSPSVPPSGAPMYPPPMPGMPPNQPYMPPPQPQAGFPPNAGHRGSMPPTPMPQHAYAAYHHQSPHMAHQHALPYGMMMPPTGPPVPHGYDAQQQGPNPMGVGH